MLPITHCPATPAASLPRYTCVTAPSHLCYCPATPALLPCHTCVTAPPHLNHCPATPTSSLPRYTCIITAPLHLHYCHATPASLPCHTSITFPHFIWISSEPNLLCTVAIFASLSGCNFHHPSTILLQCLGRFASLPNLFYITICQHLFLIQGCWGFFYGGFCRRLLFHCSLWR